MKRTSGRFLVFGALFLGFVAFSLNVHAKTVLKMSHQFPAVAAGSKIDQWYADEVKKATNGEVEIKIFWSEALAKAKENLTLLRSGAIDMAGMSAGYFPSELPFYCIGNSIAMGMDNICQSSAIMKAFMDKVPAFKEEERNNKIRVLFFHLLNPYLLVTKEPVNNLSDLKGKKFRTWGEDLPMLFKAAGATPVTIFMPEIYENLQRGVIDGCPFSLDLVVAYKLYEVAKHITEVVIWEGPAWGLWISEKSWQKLSPRNQEILLETADRARKREITTTAEAEIKAREFLKQEGVEFHNFPAQELAKWKKASPDFYNVWIEKMEKMGKGDAARQTVQLWKDMRSWIVCP
jgi:TRAP-type transport system periplasmic protein